MTREQFFEELNNGARWDVGVSINRSNPLPLDAYSVFPSEKEAVNYAETNPIAQLGQTIVVLPETIDNAKAYIVIRTGVTNTPQTPVLKELGGATIIIDSELSDTSENPVQNKVIKAELDKKQKTLTQANAGVGIRIENDPVSGEAKIVATGEGESGYELPVATPTTLGGIKVGNDFDIDTTGKLSIYKPIKIESFTNTPNLVHYGETIDTIHFNWNLNKTPTLLSLDNNVINNNLTEYDLPKSITEDTIIELTATDNRGATATATTEIDFRNYIYYGKAGKTIDTLEITVMLEKILSDDKKMKINANLYREENVDKYLYYVIPKRIVDIQGDPIFSVDGFEGGFDEFNVDSPEPLSEKIPIPITNEYGYTENYYIYRSTNCNLGSIEVEVK